MAHYKVVLLLVSVVVAVNAEWGYEGDNDLPDEWYKEFPNCAGRRQSPVDLVCESALYQRVEGPLITTQTEGAALLTNNMHTAQWSPGSGIITLTGPTLQGTYKLAQVHFHWGNERNAGSEHAFSGFKASLEMHMVFIENKFANLTVAMLDTSPEAIAVVGVLFEETSIDNGLLEPVVRNMYKIDDVNETISVPYMNFDGIDTSMVYEYSGSLTTPGCNQIVHWFVLPQLHSIGDNQIAAFRQMLFNDKRNMGNNFRPLQNLNGRSIYRNFKTCRTRFVADY